MVVWSSLALLHPLTVSLHHPCHRGLYVQGTASEKVEIPTCHQPQRFAAYSKCNWPLGIPVLYVDWPIIQTFIPADGRLFLIPNDSPAATRLGRCNSLEPSSLQTGSDLVSRRQHASMKTGCLIHILWTQWGLINACNCSKYMDI